MKKRKDFLVFGKPYIGKEEIKEVVDTLKSGWWGTGPKTELFENKFKQYVHSQEAIAVNSATAGLQLALKVLGVGPGDEVITTPLTFCSTANVIIHCGAKPVFADVDINDWNIDPKAIEKKITKKTKVILPVHLYGRPCKMDRILALAKKYKLYIVEDAAHAVEAKFKGMKIGNIGDITVFSFYVTKNLATGEGGMITTNNQKLADDMRILRLHGLSHDAYKRYSVKVFRHYQALVPGFKYNMTDIQASLGLHQLGRIEKNARLRKLYWQMYQSAFKDMPELITPTPEEPDTYHARHLYAILVKPEMLKITRDQFINQLLKLNIGSGVHFYPVHLHPYYQQTFGFKKGDYPHAEFVGDRTISLPLGANLTVNDVKYITEAVKGIVAKYRKTEMKVIIIAAGMGNRLKPLTNGKPKCLLNVAGKTILERQLEIFKDLGAEKIAIIRGYKKDKIDFADLTYFDNDDYQNNNILHSLFCARDFMNGPFVSTYSDIVYDHEVVKKLLSHPADIGVIVDTNWRKTYVGRNKHPITEAELVAIDKRGQVTKIGKDVVTPNEAHGEFIGLAKFSAKGAKILTKEFKRLVAKYRKRQNQAFQHAKEFKKAYLTDMIQELIDRGYGVYSVDIKGGWREIDTDEDLAKANIFWNKKAKLT